MESKSTQAQSVFKEGEWEDLGSCVTRLVNVLAKGTEELVEPHGLTPMDYAILRLFVPREQWTATHLAEMLPVKPPRISRLVAKLVHLGLMRRRRHHTDRRVVLLTLTNDGKALALELYRGIEAYEAFLQQGVSDGEKSALVSLTSKIMANYSQTMTEHRDATRMLRPEGTGISPEKLR